MARKRIAATRAGIYLDQAKLRREIIRARRVWRWALYDQIKDLERKIGHDVGDLLPVRWVRKRSPERYYLDELMKATKSRRYTVRYWEHGSRRPAARTEFWAHKRGVHLDELVDRIAVHYQDSQGRSGEPDSLDRFTGLVQTNRELRGQGALTGMIKHGLSGWAIRHLNFSYEAEMETAMDILTGTVDEAVVLVISRLRAMSTTYDIFDVDSGDLAYRRSLFATLAREGAEDRDFLSLLIETDQELLTTLGVAVQSYRKLVARRLGILACKPRAQSEYAGHPPVTLASLRPRQTEGV